MAYSTYFGDKSLVEKYVNGTEMSFHAVVGKNNKAMLFDLPRIKYDSGRPVVPGGNQDVFAEMNGVALAETTGNNHMFLVHRFAEYGI